MPGKIKLVYFDLRGRAEFTRFVLHAAGQEFEDIRVQFSEWSDVKPTTPYGKLPYIEYEGKKYGQSHAIAVFFAKEFGYYGQSNLDGLRIDEIAGLNNDQADNLGYYRWRPDPQDKEKYLKKVLEEDMPKYFGIYEKLLKENNYSTGFFVGKSLSLADFYVYDMTDNLLQLKKDALDGFPLLQKLRQNVEANPKIKSYIDTRPETKF